MIGTMITRSPGVTTRLGFTVGGGFRGLTDELDEEVEQAAALLLAEYGIEVTIRFNTDRLYGGAWLVTDSRDRIGVNNEIGLTVGLTLVSKLRRIYTEMPDPDETFEDRLRSDGIDPDNPPETYLTRHVRVARDWLQDATQMGRQGEEQKYLSQRVETVLDGIQVLRTIAKRPVTL